MQIYRQKFTDERVLLFFMLFFLHIIAGDASNLVKRSLKDTVQCIEDGRFYR